MKYSFNWLKELSGTEKSAEEVREELTMRALEVEGLEKIGGGFDSVVVGKIISLKKHPDADRLQVVEVDITGKRPAFAKASTGEEELHRIVCGASNIKIGDIVPVALPGAKLPCGIEIKKAKIRGVESSGMLCAEDELGLGTSHDGIKILEAETEIGIPFAEYLGVESDDIFEIKVLPDRAHDAMSHVGVAREITALEGIEFDYDFDGLELEGKTKKGKKINVEIKNDNCKRYVGVLMENVEIKDSPSWMQNRLRISGIRPINNVVDATNYVMLELGNPLHAFDLEKISGNIIVREAKDNEKLTLLDGAEIELNSDDLLITDNEKALALAGIMGGLHSRISDNTKNIFLEAASFDAVLIRKTRTRLGIQTDSSSRFEKDIDPNMAEKAMVRLVEILKHIAGGEIKETIDIYPEPVKLWKIELDLGYVERLLGETVPEKDIVRILNSLGIATEKSGNDLKCLIPTFRLDLGTQEDLIEEIGRVWGYDKVQPRIMAETPASRKVNEMSILERRIRNALSAFGLDEIYNYSFYSKKDAADTGLEEIKHYELQNPMNPDQEYVRVSLIPNILKNIRENIKNFSSFGIFEIGRAYWTNGGMPEEKRMLIVAKVLDSDKDAETFFSVKGICDDFLSQLGVSDFYYDNFDPTPTDSTLGTWHLGRLAEIKVEGTKEKIGYIGEVSPLIVANFKIGKRVAIFELDLEKLLKVSRKEKTYSAISRFPIVTRDISMLVDKGISVAKITEIIKKAGGELVISSELFDIFAKDGSNSFAFHIDLGSNERTLESKDVDRVMEKITTSLEKEIGAEVRK
ncbi:MAG: phenylalanine--tRNA ligase subunit beta [Candidatus Moranbacteria bacterium]|nr:phenylalanine--tRNA ligase subunit beta [Candidatus Moranbacteria bacterium]